MLPPELYQIPFEEVASFGAHTLHKCPPQEPGCSTVSLMKRECRDTSGATVQKILLHVSWEMTHMA